MRERGSEGREIEDGGEREREKKKSLTHTITSTALSCLDRSLLFDMHA